MVYVWLTGTPCVRRFLKKTAVPSVFQWAKSKMTAQLRRERRRQKWHEVEKVKVAAQWATVKAEEAEEEEKNRLYACAEFHVVAGEEVCSASCTLTATAEAESESCSSGAYNVCSDSSCSTASFLFPTATVAAEGNDRENVCVCLRGMKQHQQGLRKNHIWVLTPSNILVNCCTSIQGLKIMMCFYMLTGLRETVDHLQYAYSERCDCISNENQFLLMLVKLGRHNPHFELARMFGVSVFMCRMYLLHG